VFVIDQATGEPTLIQNEDVRGIYPRTFALDPAARMLAVTNNEPKLMRDGAGFKTVPANIATFRIASDGKLAFASSYPVETGGDFQFWSGMVTPASRRQRPRRKRTPPRVLRTRRGGVGARKADCLRQRSIRRSREKHPTLS
jgi:Lactonase, 7-bladed beta-propeller